ncbi:MAG: HAMP domain-containing protein, partial [Ensifer adhaerens]|nr:HAMP domain-containing protein [Ensifer adhaerens]
LVLIRDAAKAIAMGNFSTRVPLRSGRLGEVDDVIDHFNRMAELLGNAEKALQDQNNAIAHELRSPRQDIVTRTRRSTPGRWPPPAGHCRGRSPATRGPLESEISSASGGTGRTPA